MFCPEGDKKVIAVEQSGLQPCIEERHHIVRSHVSTRLSWFARSAFETGIQ